MEASWKKINKQYWWTKKNIQMLTDAQNSYRTRNYNKSQRLQIRCMKDMMITNLSVTFNKKHWHFVLSNTFNSRIIYYNQTELFTSCSTCFAENGLSADFCQINVWNMICYLYLLSSTPAKYWRMQLFESISLLWSSTHCVNILIEEQADHTDKWILQMLPN